MGGWNAFRHWPVPPTALYAVKTYSVERRCQITYSLKEYDLNGEITMPRAAVDNNRRMNLRVSPEAKAKLVRAAALRNIDLTNFVTQTALREAEAVIEAAETIKLSERDHLRVLMLLENPPRPNAKLLGAIKALPDTL